MKKFANFSFSSNLNDTATIDDLSYEYMKEYLLQTGAKKDIKEMSKLDMAKSMRLISESEYGGYRAKNFAVLMFADTPEYVGIYIYRDRISLVNHNRPLPPVTIEALNRDRSFDRRQYLNKELKDMFFSLNLIESYGSGIRRAKDSLLENGSPELKFYPDNEEDNYTNAVMGINAEFLKENFGSSNSKKTTTKTTTKTTMKQEEIIQIITKNPHISAKEMAEELNLTVDGVRYHLTKMKKAELIRHEGSTKLGRWVIIKQQ